MSRIRSQNTSLEEKAFHYLRREKISFQKHYRKAPGSPDIALPKKRRAVFIDGDFWHGWHFGKNRLRLPKSYWRGKIAHNIIRDKNRRNALRRKGWKVLRIWEHQLKGDKKTALIRIKKFLIKK